MHLLLIGMKKADNQFTRGLDQYPGLTYTHLDSTYSGKFPPCDGAILATCQMGQSQLKAAKQHFKESGTPYIVGGQSFSRIKDDLDQLLIRKGYNVGANAPVVKPAFIRGDTVIRKNTTAMGAAFKQAATTASPDLKTKFGELGKDQFIKISPPGEDAFKRAFEWTFSNHPSEGSILSSFRFDAFNAETGRLTIATKSQAQYQKLINNVDLQRGFELIMRLHMGPQIKTLVCRYLEPKVISGVELGELVEAMTENGESMEDAMKQLERENFVKPKGTEWKTGDLFQARSVYRKKIIEEREKREYEEKRKRLDEEKRLMEEKAKAVQPAPPPPPLAPVLPPVPESLKPKVEPPKPPTTPEELRIRDELISKVLQQKNFDAVKKLELIEEINAGVRTVEYQVIAERKAGGILQLTAQSIFFEGDKVLLQMERALARDIVSSIVAIEKFAKGEE